MRDFSYWQIQWLVGQTPWSAADAPVGLVGPPISLIGRQKSGSGGTRADQGVRPTNYRNLAASGAAAIA
jgi:hypothetical protein